VVVVNMRETVERILEILQTSKHNGFPVVDELPARNEHYGHLRGFILRHQLITLLKKKAYLNNEQKLSPSEFNEMYPRYHKLKTIVGEILEDELKYDLNLEPYMNLAPFTLREDANMPRIYSLFRCVGLRHLIIVDSHSNVVGIVTRLELAKFRTHYGLSKATVQRLAVSPV